MHVNCYIRIQLFCFLKFTFPKIQWKVYIFLKIPLIFSLIFLFIQLPRRVVFNSPGHGIKRPFPNPSPWQLYEGLKGKSLFYWPLYFSSWFLGVENWPRTGGFGVKKITGGTISWARGWKINWGMKVASHYTHLFWIFHWNSSSRLEDIKISSISITSFHWFFRFFDISLWQRNYWHHHITVDVSIFFIFNLLWIGCLTMM